MSRAVQAGMEGSLGSILVVDDEPVNVLVLRGILSHAGYTLLSAGSGAEALQQARDFRPDMILLDVMMPDESGFETCGKLKSDPLTANIPVIFVTSLSDVSHKLTGLDMGAVDYITKPFYAPEVVARVHSHMNFQRRQCDIIQQQASRLGQVQAAQRALLVRPEQVPGAQFSVQYVPVLEAGGDFYEVVDFGKGRSAYFVADVSGHDLGASFITSSLKALFHQHAAPERPPADTLKAMNRILFAITPVELYLTAVCLCVDRQNGSFVLSAAGHPPVLVCLGAQPPRFLDLPGSPLGLFEDVELSSLEGDLRPGDRFYLYTDGLANGVNGGMATSAGFRAALSESCQRMRSVPMTEALPRIVTSLVREDALTDDVLLLGVVA